MNLWGGDDFGDRMKMYESFECGRKFMPLLPVYARLDGRSFSSFTKGLGNPFCRELHDAMVETTRYLVKETNAKIGYTQSDEISLVWHQERIESDMFFGGKVFKTTSVLAAMASTEFFRQCLGIDLLMDRVKECNPTFDCRAFQLPNLTEAANAVLWRERDATKNAVSMAARYYYSHQDIYGKNSSQMQEMLFQKGINFNTYPCAFRRGTFVRREKYETANPRDHEEKVIRTRIEKMSMPPFGKVTNREGVIFRGEEPDCSCDIEG